MLETIRAFALEQLAGENERDAVGDAHAGWCLALAEDSQSCLVPAGRRAGTCWAWKPSTATSARRSPGSINVPTASACFAWSSQFADSGIAIATIGKEAPGWNARSHAARPPSGNARARALVGLARLLAFQGEIERTEHLVAEAVAIVREDWRRADASHGASPAGLDRHPPRGARQGGTPVGGGDSSRRRRSRTRSLPRP